MQVLEKFADLRQGFIDDSRQGIFDVGILGGVLEGIAEKRFENEIYNFANQNNIPLKVNFVKPQKRYLLAARAYLKKEANAASDNVSELKYGDELEIYDINGDFARVKSMHDGYFAWLDIRDMVHSLVEPSHQVIALRGHVYEQPRIASKQVFELSYGVKLALSAIDGDWAKVSYAKNSQGFVRKSILEDIGLRLEPKQDSIVEFAKKFLETPYTWGGVTAWGLDCSGLVQTVFAAHGINLPRDADQQAKMGQEISIEDIQKADLLFFEGHVVIAIDKNSFIHANANSVRVTIDNFSSEYGRWLKDRFIVAKRIPG